MNKTNEEVFKLMGRVKGYAEKLLIMTREDAPLKDVEQQVRAIGGIIHTAKVAVLRPYLEGGDIDTAIDKIKKF